MKVIGIKTETVSIDKRVNIPHILPQKRKVWIRIEKLRILHNANYVKNE
jgi:hypothetical protein